MFLKCTRILAFVMFAAVIATGCNKNANKKLIIASDCTWPPMEFVSEDKEIVGFDIDLMKAAAKAGGFQIEIKNVAWDGIFAGLAAGKYDAVISSVTINDERKKTIDFSEPYVNAGQTIIVRKDTTGTTLKDFEGKTAGAQISTTGAYEIEKNKAIKLKTYDEIGMAIEDLVNKRIDAVVCDKPTAANYALMNANYKQKLKLAGDPFTDENYGIAVNKGNSAVLEKINDGLKKITDSGELKAIEAKWLK